MRPGWGPSRPRCGTHGLEARHALAAVRPDWGGLIFFPSVGGFVSPFLFRLTLDLASVKGVTNRWDGEAESQWIVAARLLYHLQYLVPYLSRLQRIHLPDRLKLNAKRPRRDVPPARGSSRHMLLGAHTRPY